MKIKKRNIVTIALILALSSAVLINWHFSKPEIKKTNSNMNDQSTVNLGDAQFVNGTVKSTDEEESNKKDYFSSAKLNRKKAHDEAFEMLKKIIDDKNASSDAVSTAKDSLSALANAMKLETDTEALIKAKIKSDCVVLINNAKVQVVVSQGILNDNTILKIQEIVIGQTGILPKNITIIELNS